MLLSSVDGSPQLTVGRRSWWQLFERFQGSELHAELCARTQPCVASRDYIHSGHLGAEILSDLERVNPTLLRSFPAEVVGPLFGMTLWNLLAMSAEGEDWLFINESAEEGELGATEYFRRC